jgi:hypothetical protein
MADFKTEFQNPNGWKFNFKGANVASSPDNLQPDQYAGVLNTRTQSGNSLRARAGMVPVSGVPATGTKITDLIGIVNVANTEPFPPTVPVVIARDIQDHIYSNGSLVVSMSNFVDGLGPVQSDGVSLIAFRPNESAEPWVYIASQADYQKVQATAGPAQKVGIAEPAYACDAAPQAFRFTEFSSTAASWTPDGTYGLATADAARSTDTITNTFQDPAESGRYWIQVSSSVPYAIGESVTFSGGSGPAAKVIEDVLPAICGGSILQVAVSYYNSTTNRTTVVLSQMPTGTTPNEPEFGQLRRGALISFAGLGGAVYPVLTSLSGPQGQISFEVAGNIAPAVGSNVSGVAAIVADNLPAGVTTISAVQINSGIAFTPTSTVVEATATYTQNLSVNPFAVPLGGTSLTPQNDDYVHLSVNFGDQTKIAFVNIVFYVDSNDLYYYQIPWVPPAVPTVNQWTEIAFPISALTFSGGNDNTSLLQCTSVQIQFTVYGGMSHVAFGSLWVGGGGQPDIGYDSPGATPGAPYKYRLVARSTLTGATGNPSPVMQYDVRPHRQNVIVLLPAAIESQQDIWDVYRYGGSVVDGYHWIGAGAPSTTFVDQFFDDAAVAGQLIQTDNLEPFPSIDLPWSWPGTTGLLAGGAFGNYILTSYATGPMPWPKTVGRWLPGTLLQLAGDQAYTLRQRPEIVALSPTQHAIRFTIEECAGYIASTPISVLEPILARQILNYGWGPNEYGDVFFTGDRLRPGLVYYCKPNNPDSAPDTNNLEIVEPSEPLLGGACVGGISFVASAAQWWALYPSYFGPARYSKRAMQVGRGVISHFAMCSDQNNVYFWAKDCIAMTNGGAYQSLTQDLYPLFPHEGVPQGININRAGVTFYAPDYSRINTFRLSLANNYLFADYQDTSGTPRTLVCDLRTGGWCIDQYSTSITCHANIVQPPATIPNPGTLFFGQIAGDTAGNILQAKDGADDNGTAIPVVVDTFEWDGGDARSNALYGDAYLDCIPTVPISVQPVSQQVAIPGVPATVVPSNNRRTFTTISLNGGQYSKFLGLSLSWSETYPNGVDPVTKLFLFQFSASQQPPMTGDRASDWTDVGTPGNKWIQGFLLDANTMGAPKTLSIQDDQMVYHTAQSATVNHNGRQVIAYSFNPPFYSHLVRDVPQDNVPWIKFAIDYIFQPAPEAAQTWWTQATAFAGNGYQHLGRFEAAYASSIPVTLTITAQDGTSPQVMTLPANGGVYGKLMTLPSFNKGQSYTFVATASGPFSIWWNDCIAWIGMWGRQDGYKPYRLLGGKFGDQAEV